MKKILLPVLLSVIAIGTACNKNKTECFGDSPNHNTVARTVGTITFSGQAVWLKFGTREYTEGSWECNSSYDYCQYEYVAVAGHIPTDGEATGEIGYNEGVLHIALDKNSMTTYDKQVYYTRDGEFHWGASGYFSTSGFYMKNIADADQNTIGDIHVEAGVYPVYEDDNSILVVFEEVSE